MSKIALVWNRWVMPIYWTLYAGYVAMFSKIGQPFRAIIVALFIPIIGGWLWLNWFYLPKRRLRWFLMRLLRRQNPLPLPSPRPPNSPPKPPQVQFIPNQFQLDINPRLRRVEEPIVAFRSWRLGPEGELMSVAQPHVWKPTDQQAKCLNRSFHGKPHGAPLAGCSCGYYGYYWHALQGYGPTAVSLSGGDLVYGAFLCWGRVIRHGYEGFRAEYVRPLALTQFPLNAVFYDAVLGPPLQQQTVYAQLYSQLAVLAESRISQSAYTQRIERAARAYGIPVIPFNKLAIYAAEFGTSIQPQQ